jgi:WD40 repeat protein
MRKVFGFLLLLLAPFAARAQGVVAQAPSADWRTIETAHFRLHFPAASEAWSRRAAARLEAIRDRVVAEVGYAPPEVVDVLVSDPFAEPNGEAFPFLGWPRMILWTSPPGPESALGHYRDWSELLITHEETHLVHLLRPSRNPLLRLLRPLVPAGPIVLGAPRWVTEGYATVVEGRLSGAGRPNGDVRAAVLRRWAQAGRLPSYARLASDRRGWQGMSMAYLVGSAYLEWLEERAGPGSLRKLWARMTAKSGRSFADAFRGVFGDSPEALYDRFRAEVTWRAMEVERRLAAAGPAERREGELWQDLSWTTGDPAVSPDGGRLAIVLHSRDRPAEMVVWSTAPNTEAEAKWKQEQEKLLARDPEDVPAVRTKPLPRKPLYTLPNHDGVTPASPRWLRDGRAILYVRYEPDAQGFLHPDLFRWTVETGEVRRLTHAADVRDPDPAPDGTWAVAVRNRDGFSQLVRVELASGEVRDLTPPSVEEVYDRPRLSPDGRRVAFARHREGAWRLVVREVATGAESVLAPPPDATVSSPAWSPDGNTLYAVVGDRGFVDLWAWPAGGTGAGSAEPVRRTRSRGAALAPEPTPDGTALFYLALDPDGLDLYRLERPPGEPAQAALPAAPAPVEIPATLAPAVRPPTPPPPPPLPVAAVPPSRPYGEGRPEVMSLLGGSASSAGGVWEAGVRAGDVVGRLDVLALGALSSNGWPEGGALALAWRGWPVAVGFHAFGSRERPAQQPGHLAAALRELDLDRRGLEAAAHWDRQWGGGDLTLRAAALWNRIQPERGLVLDRALDQEIAALSGGYGGFVTHGLWRLEDGLAAHYEAGATGGASWSRYGGTLWLGGGHDDDRLLLSWQRDGSSRVERPFDLYQLGGGDSSLLPRTALAARIEVPALPAGLLAGAEHEGQRAELRLGFLPLPLFYERHRLWSGDGKGGWLALAGLEREWTVGPFPVGRLPRLDLRAGVARVLDEPLKDDTRWWLIAVWRP